jgi:protein arginine phosphatase
VAHIGDEINIVAVCTGNICRSAMAEGILSGMRETSPRIVASSAGTHALDDNPPSEFSVIACREQGIDISGHRARRLDEAITRGSDIIICMEPVHIEIVLALDTSAAGKIYNLADFSGGRKLKKITDPYGCSLREYRQCFHDILVCLGNLLAATDINGHACSRSGFSENA